MDSQKELLEEYKIKPTEEQSAIYLHSPTVHACILAGPGTGKSSTIIEYLAHVRHNRPEQTARLLTFTRAANLELADKVTEGGHALLSSTIHSFAISILLANPGTSKLPEPIRIADSWEWDELIKKDLARRLQVKPKLIDKLKQEMSAQWESLAPEHDEAIPDATRARFMGIWEEHRTVFGYSLLAELPFRLKTALEAEPALELGDIKLLAIDEYQDLNACDLACVRLLSQRGITILAVGDDDQSIYKFRKAHPNGIRHFPAEFSAPSYPLSISHRCGKNILRWANFIIAGDPGRPSKPELKPGTNNRDGETAFLVFNREDSEAQGVVRLVKYLREKRGIPAEEILILVRTKNIANYIKKALEDGGIKYSDPEAVMEALKEKSARTMLSTLRLLTNRADSLAWWTKLNLEKGIGPRAVAELYDLALQNHRTFGQQIVAAAANGFAGISQQKQLARMYSENITILDGINVPPYESWGKWILDQCNAGRLPIPPVAISDILIKMDEWNKADQDLLLGQFVNRLEPLAKDILNSKTLDHIRLMSLSRSKGLTVQATIIAAAEDGIIPHPSADRQEERRLLYVGMTRARDFLFITRARRRIGQTARVGVSKVVKSRTACPFLEGGPISQQDGDTVLGQRGV